MNADERKESELATALGVPPCAKCKGTGVAHFNVRSYTMEMQPGARIVARADVEFIFCSECFGIASMPKAVRELLNGRFRDVTDLPF